LAVTDSTTRTHRDAEDRKYHFLARSKSQATLQGKIMAFLHHPDAGIAISSAEARPRRRKACGRGRSARIADGLAIPLAITGTGEKAAADKDDF
jgi:hypothetical protein